MRRRGTWFIRTTQHFSEDKDHISFTAEEDPFLSWNEESAENEDKRSPRMSNSTVLPILTLQDEEDVFIDIRVPSTDEDCFDTQHQLGARSRRGSGISSTSSTSSFRSLFRSKSTDFSYESNSPKNIRANRSASLKPAVTLIGGLHPGYKAPPSPSNVNDMDFKGMSVYLRLLQYIRQDDCKGVKRLLKKKKIDVNVILNGSGCLLNEAAYRGCVTCIRVLLKAGSYVNMGDDEGWTPLHAAVLGSNLDAVRFLLEQNALPNQVNDDGFSPCHLAVCSDNLLIVHELMTNGGDALLQGNEVSPFQMAIDSKKSGVLKYFLYMPNLLT